MFFFYSILSNSIPISLPFSHCLASFQFQFQLVNAHSSIHIRLLKTEMTERICTSTRNTRRI